MGVKVSSAHPPIHPKPRILDSSRKLPVTMNFALCLIMSVLALIGPAVSTPPYPPRSCFFYTGANTTHATCNEHPDIVCSNGCRDSFVVAEGCSRNDDPTAPVTTQTCNISFGRDTAAAKGE
ncbi:hypothetical protein VP01_134g9 [Puccinia sorghi]|uniref:Uncharacterized protein n=1 Tax=Puccinia sorghi TaxID=27349 RepID=A0A0L6VMD7_9BASI|nr:hypothetical protein VP01_134g9 [Puccinia sorghi]